MFGEQGQQECSGVLPAGFVLPKPQPWSWPAAELTG
jgi:hypothetical protein